MGELTPEERARREDLLRRFPPEHFHRLLRELLARSRPPSR